MLQFNLPTLKSLEKEMEEEKVLDMTEEEKYRRSFGKACNKWINGVIRDCSDT
jgi:hypothetical protein